MGSARPLWFRHVSGGVGREFGTEFRGCSWGEVAVALGVPDGLQGGVRLAGSDSLGIETGLDQGAARQLFCAAAGSRLRGGFGCRPNLDPLTVFSEPDPGTRFADWFAPRVQADH